jgi:uncharacterized lipoprotein YbaY
MSRPLPFPFPYDGNSMIDQTATAYRLRARVRPSADVMYYVRRQMVRIYERI